MKRDDLVELILSYPKDTEFFILGQGLAEGFPLKHITGCSFSDLYLDMEWALDKYGGKPEDQILVGQ